MSKALPLIAVVDDEESVRRALQRLFRSVGLGVETFPTGLEFLAWLVDRLPDCVVLDLHMPLVSGFEVQSRMMAAGQHIPIVAITGHDTPENRKRVLDAGAAAYLRKPVDDEALLDAVANAMERNYQGGGNLV